MKIDSFDENVNPPRRSEPPKQNQKLNGHAPDDDEAARFFEIIDGNPKPQAAAPRPPFILGKPDIGNPDKIPVREFLYGDHYIRRYVSMTAAPGGTGKTAIAVAEALAMVTTQPLLGIRAKRPRRVWYVGEDDIVELQRRFAAAARRYAIQSFVLDWLFINSFRDTTLVICDGGEGPESPAWVRRQQLIAFLIANHIDVIILDPFHKTHLGMENDNAAMNQVLAAWIEVAERANCAIELLAHSRKAMPGAVRGTDDVRGASAQVDAARHVRALVKMSETEAATANVEEDERFRYIRFADPKVNMSVPGKLEWYRLDSVTLGNGDGHLVPHDSVQVAALWEPKSLFDDVSHAEIRAIMGAIRDGNYREHHLAEEWVGIMMLDKLGLGNTTAARKKVGRMVKAWLGSGYLVTEERRDEKRMKKKYLAVGCYEFTD